MLNKTNQKELNCKISPRKGNEIQSWYFGKRDSFEKRLAELNRLIIWTVKSSFLIR